MARVYRVVTSALIVMLAGCADEPGPDEPLTDDVSGPPLDPAQGDSSNTTILNMVALGDSVSAGHGLGHARGYPSNPETAFPALVAKALDLVPYHMSISGACAGTGAVSHPMTASNCTHSILRDELQAIPVDSAALVLITVGANDIRFSECFEAFLLNEPERDPCQGPRLEAHLAGYEANMDDVIDRLAGRFPGAQVVLTKYFNPLPPPSQDPADACDLYGPGAIVRNPVLLLVPHDSAVFQMQVLALQTEAWEYGAAILDTLNARVQAIADRAGASTVQLDATGHDVCATVRGAPPEDTWIFGPYWEDGPYVPPAPLPRYSSRPMPGPCPVTIQDPPPTSVEVGLKAASTVLGYTLVFHVNCMPHPTVSGHAAFAQQVIQALAPA